MFVTHSLPTRLYLKCRPVDQLWYLCTDRDEADPIVPHSFDPDVRLIAPSWYSGQSADIKTYLSLRPATFLNQLLKLFGCECTLLCPSDFLKDDYASTELERSSYWTAMTTWVLYVTPAALSVVSPCGLGAAYNEPKNWDDSKKKVTSATFPGSYITAIDMANHKFGFFGDWIKPYLYVGGGSEGVPESLDVYDPPYAYLQASIATPWADGNGHIEANRPWTRHSRVLGMESIKYGTTGRDIQTDDHAFIRSDSSKDHPPRFVARATIEYHRAQADATAQVIGAGSHRPGTGFVYKDGQSQAIIDELLPLYMGSSQWLWAGQVITAVYDSLSNDMQAAVLGMLRSPHADEVDLSPGASLLRLFCASYDNESRQPTGFLTVDNSNVDRKEGETAFAAVQRVARKGVGTVSVTMCPAVRPAASDAPGKRQAWHGFWGSDSIKWTLDLAPFTQGADVLDQYKTRNMDYWRTCEPDKWKWAKGDKSMWNDHTSYGPRCQLRDTKRTLSRVADDYSPIALGQALLPFKPVDQGWVTWVPGLIIANSEITTEFPAFCADSSVGRSMLACLYLYTDKEISSSQLTYQFWPALGVV